MLKLLPSCFANHVWEIPFSANTAFILFSFIQSRYNMKLNRIKAVLAEKGISQTWLAKQLGKSFSMVNAYACNRIQPNLETLQQIAVILQVDLKDLITDKEER